MKHGMRALAALLLTTAAAQAGGIDRTGQRFDGFFQPGNYAELSFGMVSPSVSGTDLPLGPFPGGGSTGSARSAVTGKFVSGNYAKAHPRTTVKES